MGMLKYPNTTIKKSTVSLTDQTVKCKFDRVSNPTYSTPPDYESEDLEKPITHSTVYITPNHDRISWHTQSIIT